MAEVWPCKTCFEGLGDMAFYAHPPFVFLFVSFGLTGSSCGSDFLFEVVLVLQGWCSQGTFTLAGALILLWNGDIG